MRLADGAAETSLALGDDHEVDVVGHQAEGPDIDRTAGAPFGHQVEVADVVVNLEERLLPAISSLREVMGNSGDHCA
jgi:hypothetical protein